MPLPLLTKEKILLLASSNAGKTYQALWYIYHTIKAGKKAFVFDCDDGMAKIGREVSPFTEIADSPNLHFQTVYSWEDMHDAADRMRKLTFQRGDLIVTEMVNYLWDWAQAQYSGDRFKQSVVEHHQDILEKGKNVQFGGFDGRADWPEIKRYYFDVLMAPFSTPANMLWTAGAKDLTPMDKESVKSMFEGIGVRNEGQRDVHYQVDTIVYLQYDRRSGEREWTTVKDRGGRSLLEDMTLSEGEDLWEMYYSAHDMTPPWLNGQK